MQLSQAAGPTGTQRTGGHGEGPGCLSIWPLSLSLALAWEWLLPLPLRASPARLEGEASQPRMALSVPRTLPRWLERGRGVPVPIQALPGPTAPASHHELHSPQRIYLLERQTSSIPGFLTGLSLI